MSLGRQVASGIGRGLAALRHEPAGELVVGFDVAERFLGRGGARTARIDSPFGSAFVAAALAGRLAPRAAAVAAPHLERLAAAVEPSGLCRFASGWAWPLPPDADDTACVVAALVAWKTPGVDARRSLDRLLANRGPSGHLRTWFFDAGDEGRRELEREVDVVVHLNVLHLAALLGRELPEDARFVVRRVREEGIALGAGDNSYYPYPAVSCYLLVRWLRLIAAFAEPGAAARAFVLASWRQALEVPLDAALLLTCLADPPWPPAGGLPAEDREAGRRLASALLAAQGADGSWPAIGFCGDPRGKTYGSAAVTTALCLEALAAFAEIDDER